MSGSTFDQRPKTQNLKLWEANDSLTWAKGRHIVKFGVQFRRWQPRLTDSGTYEGSWTFNGSMTQNPLSTGGTGDGFADFMLGFPYSVARSYPGDTWGANINFWHFFAQDSWKITRDPMKSTASCGDRSGRADYLMRSGPITTAKRPIPAASLASASSA